MSIFDKKLKSIRLIEESDWKKFYLRNDNLDLIEMKAFLNTKYYTDRLSSTNYLNAASSKKQEALFKVIGGGIGSSRLRGLIDYIQKNKDYINEEDKLNINNSFGQLMTEQEINKLIKEWKKNFESQKAYTNQQWKIDKINQLKEARDKLDYKKYKKGLLPHEEIYFNKLNKQIKAKKIIRSSEGILLNQKAKLKNDNLSGEVIEINFVHNKKNNSGYNKTHKQDKILLKYKDTLTKKNHYAWYKRDDFADQEIDLNIRTKDDFKHLLFSPGGKHNPDRMKKAFTSFSFYGIWINNFCTTF